MHHVYITADRKVAFVCDAQQKILNSSIVSNPEQYNTKYRAVKVVLYSNEKYLNLMMIHYLQDQYVNWHHHSYLLTNE